MELQELDLSNTKISDVGVVHIKKLKKLKSLDLRGTKVTNGGIIDLKMSMGNKLFTFD